MRLSNFRENDKVLLLGEGNFSFAVSLFRHNLNITITASCYESFVRHDSTRHNVDFLRAHGIRVLSGVDATNIAGHETLRGERFDKIVFNFPHAGGKMRLDKNRELLKEFFISARGSLEPDGSILVTLCNGQGGTLADKPQRRFDDTWKIKEMAAHGNFVLVRVESFDATNFAAYYRTGYRGLEKEFNAPNSLTHFFAKVESPSLPDFAPSIELDFSKLENEKENNYVDLLPKIGESSTDLDPPVFQFDITFSISEDFQERQLYVVLYNYLGKIVRNIKFVGSYEFPCGKVTRTYRISYHSNEVPLFRRRIVHVHSHAVATILENNLNVTVTR